jgi:putative ATPase
LLQWTPIRENAFIKSMRGSDPDATLYWLARLIHSGEDPRFIARRILIHASEDVGLADNTALQTAAAALTAVQHVGYPEAQIVLAHAALHIARAPNPTRPVAALVSQWPMSNCRR